MNENELRTAYQKRQPMLAAFGQWVKSRVVMALEVELGSREAVKKFFQIEPSPRVKDVDSFIEKALVRKKKSQPLQDVTDQVGVRFVVLLLKDIAKVGKVIKNGPWKASKDRDFRAERLEKAEYFAYQSDHYVVSLDRDLEIDGLTVPSGTTCEVQVRTILQHAYAEMAHSSAYKPPVRLPDQDVRHINRALAKGSALIETTDDVFGDIKDKLTSYSEGVNGLLLKAAELYQTLTGEPASPRTHFGESVVQEYRELLKGVTPEQLSDWASKGKGFANGLKRRRSESMFFRDAVVVILAYLVSHNEMGVPKKWPYNMSYLEDLYTTLGISTSGLF